MEQITLARPGALMFPTSRRLLGSSPCPVIGGSSRLGKRRTTSVCCPTGPLASSEQLGNQPLMWRRFLPARPRQRSCCVSICLPGKLRPPTLSRDEPRSAIADSLLKLHAAVAREWAQNRFRGEIERIRGVACALPVDRTSWLPSCFCAYVLDQSWHRSVKSPGFTIETGIFLKEGTAFYSNRYARENQQDKLCDVSSVNRKL